MNRYGWMVGFIGGVLVGWFAWMVFGQVDPNCKLNAIDHQQIEALQANFAHSERNNMILVSQLAEERLKKVSTLEQEVESIKVLAAQMKPLEEAVKVEATAPTAQPQYREKSRGEGFVLWLKDGFAEAKAAWRAGMVRVP